MKYLKLEEQYIDYTKLIGHSYIEIEYDQAVIAAQCNRKISIGNGNFMSVETIKLHVTNPAFIKNYKLFVCNECNLRLLFSIDDTIGIIRNNRFIVAQKQEEMSSELFYLSCNEFQIKNLLE